MVPFIQIILTAFEAVGEIYAKSRPKAPELERQRIQKRNERSLAFSVIFVLILIVMLLFLLTLE